ncbi:MAG TPA: DUF1987 domain-containing protein [Flavobacteriales bacterium]|nr:DUF1987 domain-containing protein [Flavobacteriales bacterium]
MPEHIHLSPTDTTPEVLFDPVAGVLELEGCSIHENPEAFFRPLLDGVEKYIGQPAPHTVIKVALEYFNSSSSKYLLDLLKIMDRLYGSDKGTVEMQWFHAPDDLDLKEAGQDYGTLLDMPVKLISGPLR